MEERGEQNERKENPPLVSLRCGKQHCLCREERPTAYGLWELFEKNGNTCTMLNRKQVRRGLNLGEIERIVGITSDLEEWAVTKGVDY